MPDNEPMAESYADKLRTMDDAWIREQYPRIHRAAWLMTGDPTEAEDLAQETFIVALDRWNRFEGRSSRETWLYGILIRLSQHRRRSLARVRRRMQRYFEQSNARVAERFDDENPEHKISRQQWKESVWANVARLPSHQQVAVTLRFAEQMSYQQIAETVGCALGTAKTRVHQGVKRLRQITGVASTTRIPESNSIKRPPKQQLRYPVQCNE